MNIRLLENNAVEIESNKSTLVLEGSKDYPTARVITTSAEDAVKSKTARVISWPGEYEVGSWYFKAIEGNNELVVITARVEEMKVAHFGKVQEVSSELMDKMGDIDVLFLPVSEEGINVKEAEKIIKEIDPRIVVPMGNGAEELITSLGATEVEATPRLKVTKASLPIDKTEVVRLIAG